MSYVLCVDCTYHRADSAHVSGHLCEHPSNVSPVTGEMRIVTCEDMRNGDCGVTGRLFLPTPPPVPDLPPVVSPPSNPE